MNTDNSEKLVRLNLPLGRAQRQAVREVAEELGVSEAGVIRIAITRLLAQKQQIIGAAA